ncbi:MAG: Pr6Pr family membrane protein [Defluviitaleaceae bacterium]|nr:Pr6Pr family membrane protein [Defluviitaleaceae bacterium]
MGAFYYFTIQSNILAAICLLLFIFIPDKSRFKSMIRGVSLLAIKLTGLVYNFVLYKIFLDWGTVGYTLSRTILHVVAPVGFILDWLLFDKHGIMKVKDILVWLLYPVLYCLVSLYASVRYDFSIYFFFDLANGRGVALKWLSVLLGVLVVIGFAFVGFDRLMGRVRRFPNRTVL